MNIVAFLLLMLMLFMVYRNYQLGVHYRVESRAHVFNECIPLLKNVNQRLDKANLPIIEGEFNNCKVSLSIVEDTLGWRKIPPLWLLIKLETKTKIAGSLDYIVRPSNSEFYSPSWQWNGNKEIPKNWPQHAILKFNKECIDLNLIDSLVPKLFQDQNMKELLVTPSMIRLTYMVKQAERGEYLIMRNAIYENSPITHSVVTRLLNQLDTIQNLLEI